MKNKFIVAGMATVALLSLSSCKKTKGDDYNSQRYVDLATIDADITSNLKLFYAKDEVLADEANLLGEENTAATHYELYVAKDAKNSLFTYNYDLTEYFGSKNGKNNKTATVSALAMEMEDGALLYDSEASNILSAAYSDITGVSSVLTDATFKVQSLSKWTKSVSTTKAYKAFKNDNKSVSLSIVYMPVYVRHYVKTQVVLNEYVFLPVYITFQTTDGLELIDGEWKTSTISSISTVALDTYLNSNGTVKTTTKTE